MERSYTDVESDNPVIQHVQKRLWKKNQNWLAIMVGETGSGKSWSSMKLASMIDPDFSPEQVVLDPESFMDLLVEDRLEQGNIVVWDEAGVGLSSKEYMTLVNRAVENIMETFRRRNIGVIFTVPSQYNVDKDVRRLLHTYIQTYQNGIDYIKERVKVKWLRLQYNPQYDKIYRHSLKRETEDATLPQKIDPIWIGKPRQELIDAYEEKRDEYQDELEEQTMEEIKEAMGNEDGSESSGPSKKEQIQEALEENPDKDVREIAEEYDSSPQYVRNIKSDLGLSS